jgi:glycosyltransferase involved in cell wall biosynthesis
VRKDALAAVKIVMTLLVRDEQDILRENIEFHLAHGVDQIVLMDNRSVDGTAEIAREYERTGHLRYLFQPQDDYSQARWVTAMAHYAAHELCADWVINNDADEFWFPDEGSLKDVFARPGREVLAVEAPRLNFVARSGDEQPFWRRMDVRWAASRNALGEPLPGKVAHRARADVRVEQGNHGITIGGAGVPPAPAAVTILHFPFRSRAQYRNKIRNGGAAYARNTELPAHFGSTWRYLYARYLAGEFDEAIAHECFTEARIDEGLAAGELVRDRRLVAAMTSRVERLLA